MRVSPHIPHIAIIGGGFSGAALAWHLARKSGSPKRITVFEPRPFLGAGLAYGAQDPQHRVNVPATRMSIDTSQPDDFINWIHQTDALADDPAALRPDGSVFPARAVFGRYVADRLAALLQAGTITHLRRRVTGVHRIPTGGWIITDADGACLPADIVVIATSHPAPQAPAVLRDLKLQPGQHPVLVTNPWQAGALDAIRDTDRVLVVGTGLSMADAIVSLSARGHTGRVTAISRRGQRSHAHAAGVVEPVGDFISPPACTAHALLRRIRHELARHAGQPWQAVFDRIRTQAPDIWAALPVPERRRLVRHLRPLWDTHRFRIAPQADTVLRARERAGTLAIRAARLSGVQVRHGHFAVTLRHGNAPAWQADFDAIITTTGPAHGAIVQAQPYIGELVAAGLVERDATGLGLHVDALGRACVGSQHEGSLFVAGPLARGRFGELMGLPEVTHYAEKLAVIISTLAAGPAGVSHPYRERATT